MNKQIIYRIILDILIFACIFHAWWFIALPLALIGVWRFPYFIESILAGVIYDSLFGFVSEMGVWGYAGTIASVVGFGMVVLVKKVVRR